MTISPNQELQIKFDQRIPMRDGITLSADLYLPSKTLAETGKAPAIVTRTPYLKANSNMLEIAKPFVQHGYIFVAVDVRGRGDSEGKFVPYFNEGKDGYDTIEWCATQPWSDGTIGTFGASYLGCDQWLAAVERPPHLRAMIVLVPPSDPFVESPTGTHGPIDICWQHYVSGRVLQPMEIVDWERVYEHLPLLTMDEAFGPGDHPDDEIFFHPAMIAALDAPDSEALGQLRNLRLPGLNRDSKAWTTRPRRPSPP